MDLREIWCEWGMELAETEEKHVARFLNTSQFRFP